ncbi:MAG TPA: ATP-dependent RNA helicase HrpA [Dermatophilaceae bacterium]|nr:ATP-dependent RNA helicase HrpA [Dermatophilaceae bacterium]
MARDALVVGRTPSISYPVELPVSARRDELLTALREHQVVVVAGETGSGKTTQLPKMCLEVGRGTTGLIGHTQPRRIAARAVAERLADELGDRVGGLVGYQVRFTDRVGPETMIKVMTDGVLLAELHRDRDLRRYHALIIDEAHERSLNVDVLLGYLKQLLPRRPDLTVVITSATIDPQRFADYFARPGNPVPVVEVSGRSYPVEVRYRPLTRADADHVADSPGSARRDGSHRAVVEIDQVTGICEAVEELWTEGPGRHGDGAGQDILVFLSGEREIRDTTEAVRAMNLPGTEVLPLYGRLSAAEQHQVFTPHQGRRVVLATNVAETSLTVPGIRYVVDAGTARISRFNQRTKLQRLPIEPISRASAQQRSGRCGRTADGVAIRLYAQEDFEARPEFTEPEVRRTNLASVLLLMTWLGLGDLADFPFLDPPDRRQIRDGIRLLQELGALTAGRGGPDKPADRSVPGDRASRTGRARLTGIGRRLARLPLDPRLGRMVLAAQDEGCLAEVLVVVAALSIQDVRERPTDSQTQADQAHARFRDESSDVTSLLNLWNYLRERQRELSGSAFRRMCRAEYLHYLRIREWQDVRAQVASVARQLGLSVNRHPAEPDAVHRALLAGLLSHVGWYDPTRRDYLGARGARFAIAPGSPLFRRPPEWVMAGELVETSRLWARLVAPIDPAWAERAGAHLVRRQHSEPRWSARRAAAVAAERVSLYGVPLAADRVVAYGSVDPVAARTLFIRYALVAGEWRTRHRFLTDNHRRVEELRQVEARSRRRDVVVDEEALVGFYNARIPADVVSGAHFDTWWKQARRRRPDLLDLTPELLRRAEADPIDPTAYPLEWIQGELSFPLSYQFEPGSAADGVTIHIPIDVLNRVRDEGFDWLVPGMRAELAVALVKALPKSTRRRFVPAAQYAVEALGEVDAGMAALRVASDGQVVPRITEELGRALYLRTGVRIPAEEWDWSRVPDHLRMTFRIEADAGDPLAEGKDLNRLRAQIRPAVVSALAQAGGALALAAGSSGQTTWTFGRLPARVEQPRAGRTVTGYPALVDHGATVSLEVMPTPPEAERAHRDGVRRLALLAMDTPWRPILSALTNQQRLSLSHNPHGSLPELFADCLTAVVTDELDGANPVRTPDEFAAFVDQARRAAAQRLPQIVVTLEAILGLARQVELAIEQLSSPATADLAGDLIEQRAALVYRGFVTGTGTTQLRHLPRYLSGMLTRIDRAAGALDRDTRLAASVHRVEAARRATVAALPDLRRTTAEVIALRWMVEELRVSLFAPRLKTAYPVSEKRILTAIAALTAAPLP